MKPHGERWASWLAWGVALCSLVLVVASLILLGLNWKAIDSPLTVQLPYFVGAPIVGVLGLLIAMQRPRNPIGWLLLAIAATEAIALIGDFVAMRGLLSGASPRGWAAWPAWLFDNAGVLAAILLVFVILYFPDGRLLGTRWRFAAWVVIACAAVAMAQTMLGLPPIQLSPRLPGVVNPTAVPALVGLTGNDSPLSLTAFAFVGIPLAALVARFRRSRGAERSQLRLFAWVAAAAVAVTAVSFPLYVADPLLANVLNSLGVGFGLSVLIPATIGLAVVRDGLYDIDIFVSRTLVYGTLAAFITVVYVGITVGIGTLVGSGGKPNLGLSILATAIVAVGFQPVRERVHKVANRLVYGKRATPYEVLSEFSERVAETYAGEAVLPRMARVLADGTGSERAAVWLRSGDELRAAATWPESADGAGSLPVTGQILPAIPDTDRAVAVRHQGELLGALSVSKRKGESITPIEEKLLGDLAHQAGLVLKNVGLTTDLQHRLEELRASRQRLVAAQDEERRRLERNLHDGAQQVLVAIKVKLGLAEMMTARDPKKARDLITDLKADADEALETLRDLARGIYPPLLADQGLQAAVQAQARKATVAVTVEGDGVGRYPQEVEAAVYFCVLEALQNVQKYAGASTAGVKLSELDGHLQFQVDDDGRGFDAIHVARGAGLTNMDDRLDALGGSLTITSEPGHFTRVSGSLPLPAAAAVVGSHTIT